MKKLTCTEGPLKGFSKELGNGPVVIGRDSSCSIVLDDPAVSRNHAAITSDGGKTVITDTGSTNGVYVNGKKTDRQPLNSGDVIKIGTSLIVIEDIDSMPAPAQDGIVFKKNMAEAATAVPTQTPKWISAIAKLEGVADTGSPREAVLAALIAALFEYTPAIRANVLMKEPLSGELEAVVSRDTKSHTGEFTAIPSRTLTENVTRNRMVTITMDAMKDSRFQNSESIVMQSLKSAMCAPILLNEEVAGVIYAETDEKASFSAQDASFCAVACSLVTQKLELLSPQKPAVKTAPTVSSAQEFPKEETSLLGKIKRFFGI